MFKDECVDSLLRVLVRLSVMGRPPVPTEDVADYLMTTTELTEDQIRTWFTNARRRYWPILKMMKVNLIEDRGMIVDFWGNPLPAEMLDGVTQEPTSNVGQEVTHVFFFLFHSLGAHFSSLYLLSVVDRRIE